MVDNLYCLSHLFLVVGIILAERGDQLPHQHVVDLLHLHALKSQVQVPHDLQHVVFRPRLHGRRRVLGQEIPEEGFDVGVDALGMFAERYTFYLSRALSSKL